MIIRGSHRSRRFVAALLGLLLILAGGVALNAVPTPRPAAAAQLPECPDPGEGPDIGYLPAFTDSGVAVYAGENYLAAGGAAESEGLLVAMGNATVSTDGTFNVGTVGVGSQIAPPPGTDMLVAGGDVTVRDPAALHVGANSFDENGTLVGGNINAGGAVTGSIDTNHGAIIENNPNATGPYDDFGELITNTSAELGGLDDTGTVSRNGQGITFTGDNSSELQVFTVSAADLEAAREFAFTQIPAGDNGGWVSIAINVVGDVSSLTQTYVSIDGTRIDDFNAPNHAFGNGARSLLWNFTDATAVTIGGSSQTMGTLLAPHADMAISASTNGRVLAGGDLTTSGTGNEQHNYPWDGNDDLDCQPPEPTPTGSIEISKSLTPGSPLDDELNSDGQLPRFHGTIDCQLDEGSYHEDFTIRPPNTVQLDGLPLNVPCTVQEDLAATDQGSSADGYQRVDIGDFSWAKPVITINGEETDEFTVTEASPSTDITIAIANTLLGSAELTKEVTGAPAGDTSYAINWQAENADGDPVDGYLPADSGPAEPVADSSSGTLRVQDGRTAEPESADGDPLLFPTDTVINFEEAPPDQIPGYSWQGVTFDPSQATIGADGKATVAVTATNAYQADNATFQIAKAITGDAAGDVPPDTEFRVDYTVNGEPADEPLVILANGTVQNGPTLQHGDTITFSEPRLPDVPGVDWGTPRISPRSITLDATADQPTLVTVTNTADKADATFRIHKKITGDGAGRVPDDTTFMIDYTVNGEPADAPLEITADGTVVDGPTLQHGDVITFSESDLPTVPGVSFGAVGIDPQTLTLDASDPVVTVTVTNEAQLRHGTFQLRKALDGDGAGAVPPDTSYSVDYTVDGEPADQPLIITADGAITQGPTDLPDGATIDFTEVTPTDDIDGISWQQADISPKSITIDADAPTPLVTVTNTYTTDPASFRIHKMITGDGADLVPDDTEFTVDYTVNGVPADEPLTITADGAVVDGPTLRHGDVVSFSEAELPDVQGVSWGDVNIDPQTITLDADGPPVDVTVTNRATPKEATFTIAKKITGDGADRIPDDTEFTVDYTVNGVPADEPLVITADGTVVHGPILQHGDVINFTEATPSSVDGIRWGTPTIEPETITLDAEAASPIAVTVTNQASLRDATFRIHKAITGDAAGKVPDDTRFSIDYAVNGVPAADPLVITADGAVVDGPTLRHGDVITFSEQTRPQIPGVAWTDLSITPTTLTLDSTKPTVDVAVTNTASTKDATFRISKSISGGGAELVDPDTTFAIDYTVNGTPADEPLVLKADGTVVDGPTLRDGDKITFSERPRPVDGVDWLEPLITPASLTLDADAERLAQVTVNNQADRTPEPTPTPTPSPTPEPTPSPTPGQSSAPTEPTPAPTDGSGPSADNGTNPGGTGGDGVADTGAPDLLVPIIGGLIGLLAAAVVLRLVRRRS